MATLQTGEKRVLRAIAEGRFHNSSTSTLRALVAAGLLTDSASPELTTSGKKRIALLDQRAGSMHRRTWRLNVSDQKKL